MSARKVSLRESNFTVKGEELQVGAQAPDVTMADGLLTKFKLLGDTAGKTRLISVIPSIDTGICDAQTRRMNETAGQLGDNVVVLTVSADLPMAQSRWCGAAGVDKVKMLSDHSDMAFGQANLLLFGTVEHQLRLDQRAIFIVDSSDTVRYAEYVPAIPQHPDYDAALAALKEIV